VVTHSSDSCPAMFMLRSGLTLHVADFSEFENAPP
jgi:hypothetical protein